MFGMTMRIRYLIALTALVTCVAVSPSSAQTHAQTHAQSLGKNSPFSFIAFADTQYHVSPEFLSNRTQVEHEIRTANVAFLIHLGDLKSSAPPCDNAADQKALKFLKSLNKPIVYTPGDNEWADCLYAGVGLEFPETRLNQIRLKFFKQKNFPTIAGRISQASVSKEFSEFVENVTWSHNGIRFVTVNVPGNNNNAPRMGFTWDYVDTNTQAFFKFLFSNTYFEKYFVISRYLEPTSQLGRGNWSEFNRRTMANSQWLKFASELAVKNNDSALVVLSHAGPNLGIPLRIQNGYEPLLKDLKAVARKFRKPVLWLHASEHRFMMDTIFTNRQLLKKELGPEHNLVRIIVPGPPLESYIKIDVNPGAPWPFTILPKRLSEKEFSAPN